MGEIIFLGILTALSAYFFALTGNFRISPLDKSGGAGIWPRIIIVFLLVFVVIRLLQIIFSKKKAHFVFLELFTGIRLFFLGSFIAYILLFKFLGYYASTLIFLVVTINVFFKHTTGTWGTPKQLIVRNLLIVVYVTAMWFFFAKILKIMLPKGTIRKLFR